MGFNLAYIATLVEGPNDASLTYVDPQFTMGIACTLSDTLAVCSAASGGTVSTATETVTRFAVQGGTTATGPITPQSSRPSQASGTTAPLASTVSTIPQSSQPSQTSGTTAVPGSTSSSAQKLTPYITCIAGLFILTTVLVAVLI